ncbi:MAG: phosphate ABC transporter substrate-binding protein [Nitrospirota bacterium]|nr:phosphate ABC transporter substrate-binding protein [Nitrospirota bacterium]
MNDASKKIALRMWAITIGLVIGWSGVSGFDSSTAWAKESMDDPGWEGYARVSGVSGNINSIGSDTLNNLMTLWAEGFRKQYPNVKIQIEGKGSSTAPPALIEGTAQLGPMSRKMKGKEMDAFEAKYGYKPMAFPVAIDALAVYVNKDNPIPGMSVSQVDAAFSKTRRQGYKNDITTWGDLGLSGAYTKMPISLYGRNSASGTYGFFKSKVLQNGDYRDQVKEQPGSASVVQGVTEDRAGMGYSGIGYRTSGVRAIPLAMKDGEAFVEPTFANASKGAYPLARFLFVYVNKTPNTPLSPIVKEFLNFVYSREGQNVVIKDGYFPLSADLIAKQRGNLD